MLDFEQTFGLTYSGPMSFYYDDSPDRKMGFYRHANAICSDEIKINTLYWKGLSDLHKTFLMYHEIAHAVGVGHVQGTLSDGCQSSIMNTHFDYHTNCFDKHYDYYIEELASHL